MVDRDRAVTHHEDYIAGFQFYKGPSLLSQLTPGRKLTLKREPANRYDRNAVAVLSPTGTKLGYVPSKSNKIIARLLDQGFKLRAVVTKRDCDELPWLMVKVRLEMMEERALA